MTLESCLDDWSRGWRGPLLAAVVAVLAALPALIFLPPLDRDESRFAQASAQMLETGDFVSIRYQDTPRYKKPVGIHWLQTAAVAAVSDVEARQIWAYRLPSLLGAALAAAACAWGAAAFLGPRGGTIAGLILAASQMLGFEGGVAKTDAVLCGAVTLAMAAFARLYMARNGAAVAAGRRERLLLWLGLAAATLDKGPVAPLVAGLALIALLAHDRWRKQTSPWLKDLGWGWGVILFAAVVLPWATAITVATDGAFWITALGGDLAPKLAGGQESHGALPGYHTVLAILLFFPGTLLLPAALARAWQGRHEAAIRFALAWLAPTWLAFEILPTKLPHYTLPTYGALAWLAAMAVMQAPGPLARRAGAGLAAVAAAALAVVLIGLAVRFGAGGSGIALAILAAALYLAAAAAGAVFLLRGAALRGLVYGGVLAMAAHAVAFGALLPSLRPLWTSERVVAALQAAGLDPRAGIAPGPVEIAGYAEPSLVFALGTRTGLGDGRDAAEAVEAGRPAVVEGRQEGAFRLAMRQNELTPRPVAVVEGFDYSNGDKVRLTLYRGEPQAPESEGDAP